MEGWLAPGLGPLFPRRPARIDARPGSSSFEKEAAFSARLLPQINDTLTISPQEEGRGRFLALGAPQGWRGRKRWSCGRC